MKDGDIMDYTPKTSPLPKKVTNNGKKVAPMIIMSFFDALRLIPDGKRITKLEWSDKRTYGLLKDGLLQVHKAGEAEETTHPWIINDGDLIGTDFIVV